jgi:secondary thiamine-phosphate synthase enzyme
VRGAGQIVTPTTRHARSRAANSQQAGSGKRLALAMASFGEPSGVLHYSLAMDTGLLTLFIRHTSASLLIQENADPDVRGDLDRFFARLVPDGDPLFRHRDEGADDMPAHVRAALTAVQLSVSLSDGRLALGTWQSIYLWEHRTRPHRRELALHLLGE